MVMVKAVRSWNLWRMPRSAALIWYPPAWLGEDMRVCKAPTIVRFVERGTRCRMRGVEAPSAVDWRADDGTR